MNVLIVDDDKSFGKALVKLLKSNSSIDNVFYFDDYDKSNSKLKESSSPYSIQIVNLDSIKSNNFFIQNDSQYIVYSTNQKLIKKYINNPSIQRVFQKPINLNNFENYLSKYCNIKPRNKNYNNIIDSLVNAGFGLSLKGTNLLAEAINIALNEEGLSYKDTIEIVGKNNGLSMKQVLWAINNSINRLIKTTKEQKYMEFFKIYDNRKPTPKFIIEFFVILYKAKK